MTELLSAYLMAGQVAPALIILIVGVIFASVRSSERIKPLKIRRNG